MVLLGKEDLVEIVTCAEAAARAGQHYETRRAVCIRLFEGRREFYIGLRSHGIHGFRPRQRDPTGLAAGFEFDVFERHDGFANVVVVDGRDGFGIGRRCRSDQPQLLRSENKPRAASNAARAPPSCAMTKAGTSAGRIPAKESVNARATVIAGFANEVDEVNQ